MKTWNFHSFGEKVVLLTSFQKHDRNDNKVFKEEESVEILKALGLININKQNIFSLM